MLQLIVLLVKLGLRLFQFLLAFLGFPNILLVLALVLLHFSFDGFDLLELIVKFIRLICQFLFSFLGFCLKGLDFFFVFLLLGGQFLRLILPMDHVLLLVLALFS